MDNKNLKSKKVSDVKKKTFYAVTDKDSNINKLIFPNTLQVGLNNDIFNATISGSIHQTRQGKSYLVAGSNIAIVSGSNGQVTISATAGSQGSQGDPGSNAKSVKLTASSTVIQYDAAGANPNPASITLTATSQEFTNGHFKFTGGGSAFSDETSFGDGNGGANSDTATFSSPSSYTQTPYDFRVGVAEGSGGSELVFDTLSIGTTRIGDTGSPGQKGDTGDAGTNGSDGSDGSDGANGSGVVVSLDPSSVLLIANSAGSVSDFTPSGATIKVHENGTAINVDTSLSSNSRFFVVSATGTNITAGGISQTNGQNSATIADASSITASTATIAHVVRVKNSLGVTTDYTVIQTLAKSVAGTNGTNGTDGSTGPTGPSTPDVSLTRSVIPVDTDDTGGALDDGLNLADADISQQAFTKVDVNAGATNVTFAGHNSSGNPSNNTYKIVTANVAATTDNGRGLTVTNSATSEGDNSYNITCTNDSATRLKFAVSLDGSDAKLRVSFLAEHEDGSSTDFNSIRVSLPIKVTTAAGTQTITRDFTVQKIKQGTAGASGSSDIAIFKVDTSSSLVNLTGHGGSGLMGSESTVLFDTAVIADSDVVTSLGSGTFGLGAAGSYLITVNILGTTSGGDGSAEGEYEMKLRTSNDRFSSNNVEVAALSPVRLGQGKSSLFTFSSIYLTTSGAGESIKVTMNRVGNSGGVNDQQVLNVNQNDSAIIQITKIA